ncbi:MAG: tRNA uridine-5-carboxymethylaminomethyl(34) synthesis enzyme MnmG [Gracilibacteraceae bacterium]|nr:tRNA uridine-5-carboxymethylaminomethyl(34) synthesis enzyme MnmG [Gracilibacteraceae bacterium]
MNANKPVEYNAGHFDVIVVGAGHAGCEAALAAARLGCHTALLTLNVGRVAAMPCNPSVGGPAKGHLVREIDALGGVMGQAADRTSLQARMLNTGKGPAVQALRVQADKAAYSREMRRLLFATPNLRLYQGMAERLLIAGGAAAGIVTRTGARFTAPNVVLTSGTYLRGRIIVGEALYAGGPDGEQTALTLADDLRAWGFKLGRFKTGTPPRLTRRSVDFTRWIPQTGDAARRAFSFLPQPSIFWGDDPRRQEMCWLGYTNERTHEIIRANLHRAPMYTGVVEGVGPRYCPSIEDKVVRFPARAAHQIFLEPEGYKSDELYAAGISTSLPEEIQVLLVRSVAGLEQAELLKPGYAIEYDYILPRQLTPAMAVKDCAGLFSAGQLNGTSGYEEAAAQGLLAGINAARRLRGTPPFIPGRADGYIGVLADDLVNKELLEPYRLLTARAEYRLLLRQDNADARLTPLGRQIGLVSEERWRVFQAKMERREAVLARWERQRFSPRDENMRAVLTAAGTALPAGGVSAAELIKRPEITAKEILALMPDLPDLPADELEEAATLIKYAGYISQQELALARAQKKERRLLPDDLNYAGITGLAHEARQRLQEVRPRNLGQAARVSGVTPADIAALLVYLERRRRQTETAKAD